jgi:hypothetical protein
VEDSSQRKDVFDREIAAEAQARIEALEFVDSLVKAGNYKEAYGWIWPLEDYRQVRWSEEMIKAFPRECQEFVDSVSGQSNDHK